MFHLCGFMLIWFVVDLKVYVFRSMCLSDY